MKNQIIEKVEAKHLKNKIPVLHIGDTVKVHAKIIEGKKERIQIFEGTIIAMEGGGINAVFRVRKVVGGLGVEKKFLIHSPRIAKVEVIRGGKVRRSKLYYLRDRIGSKALKLKEELREIKEITFTQEEVKQHIEEDKQAEEEAKAKRHEERTHNKEEKLKAQEEPAKAEEKSAEKTEAPKAEEKKAEAPAADAVVEPKKEVAEKPAEEKAEAPGSEAAK
jgi:large subunit ribosomal protein L19